MDLCKNFQEICTSKTVYDSIVEQAVELDYLLPDYYPSIFKILSCTITPQIASVAMMGDKVVIEGSAYIKVFYISEEDNKLVSFVTKQPIYKNIDMKQDCDNCSFNYFFKSDYVNCRASNPKRIDIRGAISGKLTVTNNDCQEILCDASGCGVHTKKETIMCDANKGQAVKIFSINEELELSGSKPSIASIFDSRACAILTDSKIIDNKVIMRGDLLVHINYLTNDNKIEIMDYHLPISQIIDFSGVDENSNCCICLDVIGTDINLMSNADGDSVGFDCKFDIKATVTASTPDEICIIKDVYSTKFETNAVTKDIKLTNFVDCISQNYIAKTTFDLTEQSISSIFDVLADVVGVNYKIDDNGIMIFGEVSANIICIDNDNTPNSFTKKFEYSHLLDKALDFSSFSLTPTVEVISASFSLVSEKKVEIRVELKVCGCLYENKTINAVTDIEVLEKPCCKPNEALIVYFCHEGQTLWDIAKKYNTSIDAIAKLNNLDDVPLKSRQMILIPA